MFTNLDFNRFYLKIIQNFELQVNFEWVTKNVELILDLNVSDYKWQISV